MMKAVVVNGSNQEFVVVEKSIPEPEAGQVRIKVMACGVCSGDEYVKFGTMPGITYPRSPGHEVAGIVDAVGEGVSNWKVGQNVGVGWHGGHCFTCDSCRRGDFKTCVNEKICGIAYDGGYQQYMIAPAEALAAIPDGLSYEEAAPLMCAGITVFNAMRNVKEAGPGDVVAVQGVGGLGHLAIQYARKMGFYTVALSRGQGKKELALQLGAHEYIDTSNNDTTVELLKKKGGARIIVTTAPNGAAASKLVNALAINGTLLAIAGTPEKIEASFLDLLMQRRTIKGWPCGTGMDSEDTLKFSQAFDVKPMIEVFPLEKANEAFEKMIANKARFRAVLTMGH